VNNELSVKEIEAVVAEFKVLFRYFSGETEQSHESPYVGNSLSLNHQNAQCSSLDVYIIL
jgi:hypothetical protein